MRNPSTLRQVELCSRTTRRREIGLIPPEIQTEALKNALSVPQPAAHGPVALPCLAQGVCRKLLHFCISIPTCKGFDLSINSLFFPLATQSSRGRSPLLPSAAQMDGTPWNICAPQTRGQRGVQGRTAHFGNSSGFLDISFHQESTAQLPHLCSQMWDNSNSSH